MRELSKVREEIEVMRAQLENLERSVAYSTVSIAISEEEHKKDCVKILFRVLDSREEPVPNTSIYVKGGGVVNLVTDEFDEAEATFKKGSNITLIAAFHRPDGEVLKRPLRI